MLEQPPPDPTEAVRAIGTAGYSITWLAVEITPPFRGGATKTVYALE